MASSIKKISLCFEGLARQLGCVSWVKGETVEDELGKLNILYMALNLGSDSRILVTGGAGFIGSTLALHLSQDLGIRVTALDDFNPYYSPALKRARWARLAGANVGLVEGDLCDDALLDRLFRTHNFTHVASLAAQAGVRYSVDHPQAYVRANVQCFVSLLEAVRRRPQTVLVYASSSSVYGTNTKAPFSELDHVEQPACNVEARGATKLCARTHARAPPRNSTFSHPQCPRAVLLLSLRSALCRVEAHGRADCARVSPSLRLARHRPPLLYRLRPLGSPGHGRLFAGDAHAARRADPAHERLTRLYIR